LRQTQREFHVISETDLSYQESIGLPTLRKIAGIIDFIIGGLTSYGFYGTSNRPIVTALLYKGGFASGIIVVSATPRRE
jgi:hypothetical protein